jgi:hypothetical protein
MNTKDQLNLLGLKVRDRITGYEGIVTSISFDLYGCIQAILTQRGTDKEGKSKSLGWIDTNRLEVCGKHRVMDPPWLSTTVRQIGSADKPIR